MDEPGGNDVDKARHIYGPRPIGALMPAITRPAFKRRAPAAAQVMADWAAIVGPALAAVATPRRLVAGTLTLACSGPIALELQHLSGQLIARVNGHMGRVVVERLRFMQDPPPASPPSEPAKRRPKPVKLPGVPSGPLRDALAALGRAVSDAEGA